MTRIETYVRLFENAPIAAAILEENTLKVDLANDAMLKIWGREPEVVGMNLLDFMPELKAQGFQQLINNVFKTGQYYHSSGSEMKINKAGKMETVIIDYSYTFIPAEEDHHPAILVLAKDVSQYGIAQKTEEKEAEEADRNLHAVVMAATVPMCVFKGDNLEAEFVNSSMLNLWDNHEKIHDKTLKYVFTHGSTFTEKVDQILYSYTPLKDSLGKTNGVVVTGNKLDH